MWKRQFRELIIADTDTSMIYRVEVPKLYVSTSKDTYAKLGSSQIIHSISQHFVVQNSSIKVISQTTYPGRLCAFNLIIPTLGISDLAMHPNSLARMFLRESSHSNALAQLGGHPFMTSTGNPVLTSPAPVHTCPHETNPHPLLWTSTCGRHEIHITLLK